MKNKVVSLFFLGTNCHRSSYQDALTNFYKAAKKNGTAARLFDGVGSDPEHLSDKHPTPGQYVYDAEENIKKKISSKISQGVSDLMKRLTGCLAGDGMDDLLFESILYLENLIKNNGGKMPETVNLHGFSRGADACLRLANLLDTMYPEVKVNLFLIDQVPGPGRGDHPSSYTIPKNVQRFESVLMLHEYTPGFDPQDRNHYVLASPHTTKVSTKVYPGWHGKAMLLSTDKKTNHVPRLLHDDFFRFAKETGSLPQDALIPPYKIMKTWTEYDDEIAHVLSPADRFHEYNQMQENWWFYAKGTQLNTRDVLTEHKYYSQDHQLFVNQEHGELFQKFYPNLFDRFLNGKKVPEEEVIKELGSLDEETPEFYERFCRICSIKEGQPLPEPRNAAFHFHTPLGDTPVKDELTFLKHSITAIINYSLYHSQEDTLDTKIATKWLKEILDKAHQMEPEQATQSLHKAIYAVTQYLSSGENPTGYMALQLKKLSQTPERLVQAADKFLEEHYNSNPELHPKQQKYIVKVRQELQEIKDSEHLDYFQKLKEVKSILSNTADHLQQLQMNDDSVISINFLAEAYHKRSKLPTFNQLITGLNALSAPGYAETSLASDIGKDFEAYYKRNLFWNSVNKILSAIMPISIPPFVSSEKSDLAHRIYTKLGELDKSGQGNNLTEISKVLTEGQKGLHEIYVSNKALSKGEFDKTMEKSQGKLNSEISVLPLESIHPLNSLAQ
ncbi:DUF5621 domain-containing protein [Legionella maioricensis]|uniref:DUF5621 domain-containing protein n=1 Tax=Legionella maioricensis TaxID=2896528 RepID=A0A9X2IC87_9GAMM|nr:DUF5621 domain-containing protein [Legionella maioricensis]MCL9683498.1 DUF5621 domain-containing protein [Legionella maioricensis]MCL9686797.1 DUF5621 domain-containing protein [Legionella maioricensis]